MRLPSFNKKRMCLAVGVSRAVIYKTSNLLTTKDELLRVHVLSVLSAHPSYNHRRIVLKLKIGKKSSPWKNAYQESFYNNFKTDLGLEFERFNTPGELIEAIHQTINTTTTKEYTPP